MLATNSSSFKNPKESLENVLSWIDRGILGVTKVYLEWQQHGKDWRNGVASPQEYKKIVDFINKKTGEKLANSCNKVVQNALDYVKAKNAVNLGKAVLKSPEAEEVKRLLHTKGVAAAKKHYLENKDAIEKVDGHYAWYMLGAALDAGVMMGLNAIPGLTTSSRLRLKEDFRDKYGSYKKGETYQYYYLGGYNPKYGVMVVPGRPCTLDVPWEKLEVVNSSVACNDIYMVIAKPGQKEQIEYFDSMSQAMKKLLSFAKTPEQKRDAERLCSFRSEDGKTMYMVARNSTVCNGKFKPGDKVIHQGKDRCTVDSYAGSMLVLTVDGKPGQMIFTVDGKCEPVKNECVENRSVDKLSNAVPIDDSYTPMAYIKGMIKEVTSNPSSKSLEGGAWKVVRERPNYRALSHTAEYKQLDKLVGINATVVKNTMGDACCDAAAKVEKAIQDMNKYGVKAYQPLDPKLAAMQKQIATECVKELHKAWQMLQNAMRKFDEYSL